MKYVRTIVFLLLIILVMCIALLGVFLADQSRRLLDQIQATPVQTSQSGIQHILLEFHPVLIYPWLLYTKEYGFLFVWALLGSISQADGKQLLLPLFLEAHSLFNANFSAHTLFQERVKGSIAEGGIRIQPEEFPLNDMRQKLKQKPTFTADIPLTKIPQQTIETCGARCEVLNALIPSSKDHWRVFSVLPVLSYMSTDYE